MLTKIKFYTLTIGTLLLVLTTWRNHPDNQPPTSLETTILLDTTKNYSVPVRFRQLLVGDRIYVSGSPCAEDFATLAALGIEGVIRLNGDGKDAGCLGIRAASRAAGAEHIHLQYFNIEGRKGVGPAVAAVGEGRKLIYCKHGAHRSILVAACYMLEQGVDLNRVVAWTKWTEGKKPVWDDPRYAKYVNILKTYGNRTAT